jgi:hypothetical protein
VVADVADDVAVGVTKQTLRKQPNVLGLRCWFGLCGKETLQRSRKMSEINGKKIAGYLQKRGEKGLVKGMKKRWFLFNGEDPEKRVFYYPARDDMKQDLGFISMEQVTGNRLLRFPCI